MAANVTLANLRLAARERADMVNSRFITDAELTRHINDGIKDLYDKLINSGEFYYVSSSNISIVDGTDTYALPATFYKLLGVDYLIDAQGNAVTLKPFQFESRNSYLYTPSYSVVGLSYLRYMIQGNNIKFVPMPSGTATIKLWYAPAFTDLSADGDTFDGINGWEDYVIIDAAIKMLMKEESDPQLLMLERENMTKRLNEMKIMRDIGSTSKIADTSRAVPWEYWGFEG